MRRLCAAMACFWITGCTVIPSAGPPVASLALRDDVTAIGPEYYCAVPNLSQQSRGFAVFVGCDRLSSELPAPLRDALISVQVGSRDTAIVSGQERALRDVLRSTEGQTLLAGENAPQTITIDTVDRRDGIVFVHFTDTAPPLVEGLDGQEWRAFFDLGDRLATIGVRGYDTPVLTRAEGLQLLREAVDALRLANAAPSSEVQRP